MTREKKEIVKKIDRVQLGVEMDDLMGVQPAPGSLRGART